jgi:hypothetical protein
MTPGGEISRIAEHTVGTPDHEVRDAWNHVEAATGAQVRFHGLRLRDGLNVPFAPPAHLGAAPSGGDALDVELGMRLTRTGGSGP